MNKSNKFSSSFVLLIVIVMFAFFCFMKFSQSPDVETSTAKVEKAVVPVENTSTAEDVPVEENQKTVESEPSHVDSRPHDPIVTQPSVKAPDPLLNTIADMSRRVNQMYNDRLQKLFKDAGKENYYESYTKLKSERDLEMAKLVTSNSSRAAMVNLNYEYHNKLLEVIGPDLYKSYLQEIKKINSEAKNVRIVIEF